MIDVEFALSLIRPWPTSILLGGKRCENRTWTPPAKVLGRYVALHAGRKWDYDAVDFIRARWPDYDAIDGVVSPEGIVGVARVVGALDMRKSATPRVVLPMDGDADVQPHDPRIAKIRALPQSPWWMGPVGWLLEDVRAIARPVPCAGALSVWRLPDKVRTAVREQLAA